MESLAYVHQSIAYSDPQPAPKVVLWQSLNWQKPPSSAWLKFLWLSVIITATIAISETAQAATVQVETNSGIGVKVRTQPGGAVMGGIGEGGTINAESSGTPGWSVITSGAYAGGYVSDNWLVKSGGGSGGGSGGAAGVYAVKTNSGFGVKVRNQPGGKVMGGIEEGGRIDVESSGTPGWSVITSGAYAGGYVSDNWLVKSGGGSGGDSGGGSGGAAGVYVVRTNSGFGMKVRTQPGGAVMGGIGEGGTINAESSGTPGWLVVTSGTYAGGYISDSWAVPLF